jgi:hypothetical protein
LRLNFHCLRKLTTFDHYQKQGKSRIVVERKDRLLLYDHDMNKVAGRPGS